MQDIINMRDVILAYKERALAEESDLLLYIKKLSDKKIEWYNQTIQTFRENISKSSDENEKKVFEKTIKYLEERKGWLEQEKNYKIQVAALLQSLAKPIDKLPLPIVLIPQLSTQCFTNVKDRCNSTCKQGKDYGCHDKLKGCVPDKCQGGNPCPVSEIQAAISQINSPAGQIKGICQVIIGLIDSIPTETNIQYNMP